MAKKSQLKRFLSVCQKEGLCKSSDNLEFYMKSLWRDIDLKGKSVIDIGAGAGTYGFYAALSGASKVVCLEPEAAGSRSGFIRKFRKVSGRLKLPQIKMIAETFQEYQSTGEKFDILLLHHSINHLDEDACITLHENTRSRRTYREIFNELSQIAKPGAKLVVTDASRNNFFPAVGLKNPFVRSIEWHKHQAPQVWVKLLSGAGFRKPKVSWIPPSQLRQLGQILCANFFASYFLHSHFRLIMERSGRVKATASRAKS